MIEKGTIHSIKVVVFNLVRCKVNVKVVVVNNGLFARLVEYRKMAFCEKWSKGYVQNRKKMGFYQIQLYDFDKYTAKRRKDSFLSTFSV